MPATRKQPTSSTYDVHPGLAMYQNSQAALKQKTGRTLEEWIKFVQKEGPATEKERRAWLKAEHGLGMNYAGGSPSNPWEKAMTEIPRLI